MKNKPKGTNKRRLLKFQILNNEFQYLIDVPKHVSFDEICDLVRENWTLKFSSSDCSVLVKDWNHFSVTSDIDEVGDYGTPTVWKLEIADRDDNRVPQSVPVKYKAPEWKKSKR